MNIRFSIAVFVVAALLVGCFKRESARTEQTVEQSQYTEHDALDSVDLAKPTTTVVARRVDVIHDKFKVERMVHEMETAYEQRKPSKDVSIRPTPSDSEQVVYKGKPILDVKEVSHWEVAPNGNVVIQAHLTGETAVPDGNPETDSEGQEASIDPLAVWISVGGGMARRITAPNVFAGGVAFSPSGSRVAISETVRNEKRWPISKRVRVIDVSSGKSLIIVTSRGHDSFGVGEWLSENKLQVITVGEASYNAIATYEIPPL